MNDRNENEEKNKSQALYSIPGSRRLQLHILSTGSFYNSGDISVSIWGKTERGTLNSALRGDDPGDVVGQGKEYGEVLSGYSIP